MTVVLPPRGRTFTCVEKDPRSDSSVSDGVPTTLGTQPRGWSDRGNEAMMGWPARDSGFTLIEVLVATVLFGIFAATALSGWSAWSTASAHAGTAREIQSVLRHAQQQAVTEGRSICVQFKPDDDTYAVFRGACALDMTDPVRGPMRPQHDAIDVGQFLAGGSPTDGVTFTRRGTATAGTIEISRSGADSYVLTVGGVTGRVTVG